MPNLENACNQLSSKIRCFGALSGKRLPNASILVTDHPTVRKRPLNLGILGGGCLGRFGSTHPNAMIRRLLVLNAVDTLLSPPLGILKIYIKKV